MSTRASRPAPWLATLLPAIAVVGLVGCNGLPLGLISNVGAAGAGTVIPGDEARFKAEATAAAFGIEFKAEDGNADGQWTPGELAQYLAKNPLPEAFLLELEAMASASAFRLTQAEVSASATSTIDVVTAPLDKRVLALLAKLVAKFDANGDGTLSTAEALAFRNEAYKRRVRPATQPGQGGTARPPATDGDKQTQPGADPTNGGNRPGFAPGEIPPGGMPAPCADEFKRADANGDGQLSWEEHWAFLQGRLPGAGGEFASSIAIDKDATHAEFSKRDRDGNGQLSLDEHCAGMTGGVMPPPNPGEDCYGRHKQADRNADAKLSWEEFFAFEAQGNANVDEGLKARIHERFQKADLNDDEHLQPEEWRQLCGEQPPVMPPIAGDCVKVHDANGDGRVSIEEWLRGHANMRPEDVKLKFEGLDRNRDGFLDATELGCGEPSPPNPPVPSGCEEAFKRHDRDGDGRLVIGEFGAFMEATQGGANAGANGTVASAIARDWSTEFRGRDRNGDGFVDPSEACGGANTPPVANPPADACAEFKKRDLNGDGKVSLEEHLRLNGDAANMTAELRARLEAEFKGRDANGDGALGREELGCK